jgi:glycosyltransferase involved in cell wall biosynthesis
MLAFNKSLVVSHIVFRKAPPFEALEGPYSSVGNALQTLGTDVDTYLLPIDGFEKEIIHGSWNQKEQLWIPPIFGKFIPFKYLVDSIIIGLFSLAYCLKNRKHKLLVVGIDPLCCVALITFKKIFNYKLIFYSVDFNHTRFTNKALQYLYEKADELSSKYADQTWVVCESLKEYKKSRYQIESVYIPNSPIFNPSLFENGRSYKTGNKLAWTGSFLTNRQYDMLFSLLQQIQEIRPDMEFYFAPMGNYEKFRGFAKQYKLLKSEVLELHSRSQWQEFASKCDVGIAVYDPKFGSTEFIEPLKIWDFMVCGMPFIISCEPSVSQPIKDAGVAYFLSPDNRITNKLSLDRFLQRENLTKLQEKCVEISKEYSINRRIEAALTKLN